MLIKIGKFIRGYFVLVGVLTTLLFLVVLSAIPKNVQPMAELPAEGDLFLQMKLRGSFVKKATDRNPLRRLMGGQWGQDFGPYLPEFRYALHKAAQEERVKGILLEADQLVGGLSEFAELRQMLNEFKKSGKKILYFGSGLDSNGLFLAAVADRIILPPLGHLMIPGPVMQQLYFSQALKKLGVEFEVLRLGEFKSFGESFVQNRPSQESALMYEGLEKDLRRELVQSVAQSRSVTNEVAFQWFKKGVYTAREALDAKIIDAVEYRSQVIEEVEKEHKIMKFSQYLQWVAQEASPGVFGSSGEGLAVIEAVGEIRDFVSDGETHVIAPERIIKEIEWAKEHKNVKGVLLRIDSPGGSALAADQIWHAIKELALEKPVVASFATVAASGGYYIAAPAKKIFAEKASMTGSIGVFGLFPNIEEAQKKYGFDFYLFTQTDRKDLFHPGKSLSKQDKELFQGHIKDTYDQFLDRVAQGRGRSKSDIDKIGRGKVYTGVQAKGVGLVDEIGGYQDAMHSLKELAGMDPEKFYPLHRYKPKGDSIAECLLYSNSISDCLDQSAQLKLLMPHTGSFLAWLKKQDKPSIQALWTDGLKLSPAE